MSTHSIARPRARRRLLLTSAMLTWILLSDLAVLPASLRIGGPREAQATPWVVRRQLVTAVVENSKTISTSWRFPTEQGSLLLVAVSVHRASGVGDSDTVVPPPGLFQQVPGDDANAGGQRFSSSLFYMLNSASRSGAETVTVNPNPLAPAPSRIAVTLVEYVGVAKANALDVSSSWSAWEPTYFTSTAPSGTPPTSTAAHEIWFGTAAGAQFQCPEGSSSSLYNGFAQADFHRRETLPAFSHGVYERVASATGSVELRGDKGDECSDPAFSPNGGYFSAMVATFKLDLSASSATSATRVVEEDYTAAPTGRRPPSWKTSGLGSGSVDVTSAMAGQAVALDDAANADEPVALRDFDAVAFGYARLRFNAAQTNAYFGIQLQDATKYFHIWLYNTGALRYKKLNDDGTFNSDSAFPTAISYAANTNHLLELYWDFRQANSGVTVLLDGVVAGRNLNSNVTSGLTRVSRLRISGHPSTSGTLRFDDVAVRANPPLSAIIDSDFEPDPVGGMSPIAHATEPTGTDIRIQTSGSGGRAIWMEDLTNSAAPEVKMPFVRPVTTGGLATRLRPSQTGETYSVTLSGSSGPTFRLALGNDGHVKYERLNDDGSVAGLENLPVDVTYVANTTHLLEVGWNLAAPSSGFTVDVDGTRAGTGLNRGVLVPPTSFERLTFAGTAADQGVLYVDDVRVDAPNVGARYDADFELETSGNDPVGWTVAEPGSSTTNIAAFPPNGRAIEIFDATGTEKPNLRKTFTPIKKGSVKLRFRPEQTDAYFAIVLNGDVGSFQVYVYNDGHMRYVRLNPDGTFANDSLFPSDRLYTPSSGAHELELYWDFTAAYTGFNVRFDGITIGESLNQDVPLHATEVANLWLTGHQDTDGTLYVDDIRVRDYTTSS